MLKCLKFMPQKPVVSFTCIKIISKTRNHLQFYITITANPKINKEPQAKPPNCDILVFQTYSQNSIRHWKTTKLQINQFLIENPIFQPEWNLHKIFKLKLDECRSQAKCFKMRLRLIIVIVNLSHFKFLNVNLISPCFCGFLGFSWHRIYCFGPI